MSICRHTTLMIAYVAIAVALPPAQANVIGTPDNSSVQSGVTVLDPATGLPHTDFSATTIDYTTSYTYVEKAFDLGRDGTGIMTSSADASSGELKTYLWADNRLPPADPTADIPNVSHQEVSSGITDRIFIKETFTGFIPVTLTLRVDGITAAEPGPASFPLTAIAQDILAQILFIPAGDEQEVAEKATWLGDPMDGITVTATFDLPSGTPYFDVSYTLALYQTNNNYLGEIDYFSTAIAGISLPAGYTFTSESGAFLSAVPNDAAIDIEKFTNGADADGANDSDVPRLKPGTPVTWTYHITNTGGIAFSEAEVTVTDNQPGVTPVLDSTSDDGDKVLSPGETWIYSDSDPTLDLATPPAGIKVVAGCNDYRNTYQNTGRVSITGTTVFDEDLSHYCNSSDFDGDGIADHEDNCTLVPNGPLDLDAGGNSQRDADSDGYGNSCDPDFDNNLTVDFADLAYMKSTFFTADPYADLDGNGRVDFGDLAILKSMFFGPPGPSGLAP